MSLDEEKAKLLYKLLRGKKNIGACYDRLEHLKRFSKEAIKELVKDDFLIMKAGKKFQAVSINPKKVKEAIEFVGKVFPNLKDDLV